MLDLTKEEENNFIMAKKMFFDYLGNNNIFDYKDNDYQLNIQSSNDILLFYFQNNIDKSRISFTIDANNKDKDKLCFLYSSSDAENVHIVIKKDIKNYKISKHIDNANLDDLTYEDLDKKDNVFNKGIQISGIIQFIFDSVAPHVSKEDFKLFSKNIKLSNLDDYISLIEKNNKNIKNLVLASNEAARSGFNIFKLSEQEKELIQLNTDILFDFNEVDKKNIISKLIDTIIESGLSEEEKEYSKKNKTLFQNLKAVFKK